MTGANVFNWTAQSASSTLNADAATSKSKAGTTEMASLFASMMNTNYSTNSNLEYTSENAKQGSDITVTEDAYNRYQYRDNSNYHHLLIWLVYQRSIDKDYNTILFDY